MVSVLDKPEQMQPLRAQARRDIEERFDLERIALPRLISLVKELASATGIRTGVLPASDAIGLAHGE
jgi:hypothetical protein